MNIINSILWAVATVFLIFTGIYFSIKFSFIHLNLKKIFKSLKNDSKYSTGISSFQSLSVSLGASIGVGSLAGIALAIYKGGIGSIFWIWITCLITVPNTLVENTLSVIYQEKNNKNYYGGPAYYIKKGLGQKKLAISYAVIVTIGYLLGFLSIQSNVISKSFTLLIDIDPLIIGIITAILSFYIIIKGTKKIAKFSEIFIPLMGIIYLIISLIIILKNINIIPNLIYRIIKEAFNFNSLKMGIFSSIIIGIQRCIFSSESGIGTSSIASGSVNTNNPFKQGLLQTFGVYFIIFIICTSTALIILTSNYNVINYIDINGIEIVKDALYYHLGSFGNIILYFTIIAFSFSTIVSGYYYSESNIRFIFKNINQTKILIIKIITCLILIISSVLSPTILWNSVDILISILAIINIYAIFNLRKDVIYEYLIYKRKCKNDRK